MIHRNYSYPQYPFTSKYRRFDYQNGFGTKSGSDLVSPTHTYTLAVSLWVRVFWHVWYKEITGIRVGKRGARGVLIAGLEETNWWILEHEKLTSPTRRRASVLAVSFDCRSWTWNILSSIDERSQYLKKNFGLMDWTRQPTQRLLACSTLSTFFPRKVWWLQWIGHRTSCYSV